MAHGQNTQIMQHVSGFSGAERFLDLNHRRCNDHRIQHFVLSQELVVGQSFLLGHFLIPDITF